jgi:hypothetical protein
MYQSLIGIRWRGSYCCDMWCHVREVAIAICGGEEEGNLVLIHVLIELLRELGSYPYHD